MPIITNPIREEKKGNERRKEKSKRISTGIENYDTLLGGGYFPGSFNLISGCSGSGKTLFCMTFLYVGAKKFNRKGVYITLEEDTAHLVEYCNSLGMDINKYEDKITIMDIPMLRKLYTNKEEIYNENSLLDIDNLIDLIKKNCHQADIIAIDSIVPLSMKYSNLNEFRAALFRLKIELKELKATSIITTEIPSESVRELSRFGIEDFLADSVTILKRGDFEKDNVNSYSDKYFSERFMRIHKIRGSDHLKSFVEYKITNDGIIVFPPAAIFR